MIDLRRLREDPELFRRGARLKGVHAEIDRALALDAQVRELHTRRDEARAQQNRLAKESGPKIGQLMGGSRRPPARRRRRWRRRSSSSRRPRRN